MTSFETGRKAETVAAHYLENKGYTILDRNWRTRWCEIDIVAQKDTCIYFVEVKYRKNSLNGSGLDHLTPKKLAQMTRAAESWIQIYPNSANYELIAIEVTGYNYHISYVTKVI